MTTQITEYSKTEAALSDLTQRFKDVVFDVTTTAGMMAARKGRAEIRGYRTALESLRVEIKAPALERCRLIDAEAKRITAELLALEEPIDSLIKNEEQRKERERAEKERAEKERIERIQTTIARLGHALTALSGRESGPIAREIERLDAVEIGEFYAEFSEQAQAAKDAALAKLRRMHAAAIEHEAEQERIKTERAELARLKAEQERREREEAARIAEERRKRDEEERAARGRIEAEQRKAAAERAEQDRIAREKREAEERAARQRIEEEERKARQAREEADRTARQKREAEEARLKAERDRIEAERRAVEERERKAREEAEAKEREIRRLEEELLDGRRLLASFVKRYGKRKEFRGVAAAISAFLSESEQIA